MRDEPEDAGSPGSSVELALGLPQQRLDLGSPHEGEREERERSGLGDLPRERGDVAHPGHRALDNGVARAMGARQRAVLGERSGGCGRREVAVDGLPEACQDTPDGVEAGGQPGGEGGVLAK
ncbi:MAG: hypothetical protein DLM61_25850 [Pseudonocardiales bacterium]|nr:MAG: hypothetical protein DLM61_25850 [Pseudonocardiales bacterium]